MNESRDSVLGKERHLAPDTVTHSLGLNGAFFVSQLRLLYKTTTWLKQQTFIFLTVLEAESPRSGCQ